MNFSSLSAFLSSLGKFWQDKSSASFLRWNIFFIIFQFVYLFFRYQNLPPEVPIFFSQPWGQSWLAPSAAIFLLPFFSLLIGLANHVVALIIHIRWPLLSRLLIIFSLIFSILASVSLYQIIRLAV